MSEIVGYTVIVAVIGYLPPGVIFTDISTDSATDSVSIFRSPLKDEQLAQFRRTHNALVAARLDRDVYDWLRKSGEGYSTRINHILRAVMSKVG